MIIVDSNVLSELMKCKPMPVVEQWLAAHPVRTIEDAAAFETECERLRREEPLIPDASIDVVVSSCVLNLVRPQDKVKLFQEIFRVLRRGGRAVISDIVCDEPPTDEILNDPELWSGCIAGAWLEEKFLAMFEEAEFHGRYQRGSWPQIVDPPQDFPKHFSSLGNFVRLERDVASMS